MPTPLTHAQQCFIAMAKAHGLPEPVPEFRFHLTRKWRFDWLFNPGKERVAVEIQGGLFTQGGHVRGAHLVGEYEKLNEAQIMGYKVLLVTPQQVESGEVFELVKRTLSLG
jgi:hypothetical protein